MLPRERLEIIKTRVTKDKKVYVSELSKEFSVTEETIRRDLDKLEKLRILTRSYGGAILNEKGTSEERLCDYRLEENLENEKHIAQKTMKLINEGSTIIADSGKEVLEVLKLLRNRNDLTVIKNSIEVLKELNQADLNIIVTGGIVNHKVQTLQGNIAKNVINNYNVDIALISCSGLDINKGISDLNEAEVEIKREMIRQAEKVILLADNTKFDKMSLVNLFDYEKINYIVTNRELKEEWMKMLNLYNVQVIF